MLFFALSAVALIPFVAYCVFRREPQALKPSQQLLDDFRKLLDKERGSLNPDHMVYRYLWWDMPENYEFVNRLLARGFWRDNFVFTNGKSVVWFERTPAMGWTAYRTDKNGRKSSLWLPDKFPQQFSTLLG